MSKKWFASTRAQAFSLIGLEFILILVIAIILLFFKGLVTSYSLLLGGLVSILPNLYFTHKLFKDMQASAAKKIIRRFYRGEFIKLLLMALLFITLVKWAQLQLLPFVIGFLIAQMGVWLAPLFLLKGEEVKH